MNGLVQFADVQQNLIQFKHSNMQRVIRAWNILHSKYFRFLT